MSSNLEGRLRRIESRVMTRTCHTCWGSATAVVFVPDGADEEAPEYQPTHCKECGRALQHVTRIIGISEDEMYGEGAMLEGAR